MEPKTIRCKFICSQVSKRLDYYKGKRFLFNYEFSAVTSGSEENKQYFAYTPSGSLNVGSFVDDLFEPGKEYYLDITEVVPPEPVEMIAEELEEE